MASDRRVFIKRGLLGGAALAIFGGGYLAVRRGEYPDAPPRNLRVLDEVSFWVLVAVAERVAPVERSGAMTLAHEVDVAMSVNNPGAQRDFVRALYLLENALAGLLFRGTPQVFTRLPAAAQDEALVAWRDSRLTVLASAYQSFRRLVLGAHYASAERAREVGYPGPRWLKPAPAPVVDDAPLSPPFVPEAAAGGEP